MTFRIITINSYNHEYAEEAIFPRFLVLLRNKFSFITTFCLVCGGGLTSSQFKSQEFLFFVKFSPKVRQLGYAPSSKCKFPKHAYSQKEAQKFDFPYYKYIFY